MGKRKQYKSEAFAAIDETMEALHQIEAIDKKTMRDFDAACLADLPEMEPETLEAMRKHGEDQTDRTMSHDEAMGRHADPKAPQPYAGWEDTITVALPEVKAQITLRLDRDMVRWLRAKGKGYQTLMNAVLRGY